MARFKLINEQFDKDNADERMTFMIKPFGGHDISDVIFNVDQAFDKDALPFSELSSLDKFIHLFQKSKDYSWKNYVQPKWKNFRSQIAFNAGLRGERKIDFQSLTPRRGYYVATFWTMNR